MRFIAEYLDAWAARQPDKQLFCFLGANGAEQATYSYERFAHVTRRLAAWLCRTQDLRRGDRVLLAYPAGLDMVVAFFACARSGLIAVPTARPNLSRLSTSHLAIVGSCQRTNLQVGADSAADRSAEALARFAAIATDCDARAVLTDRLPPGPDQISMLLGRPRWIATAGFEAPDTAIARPGAVPDGFGDTPCPTLFLQYTSGSTGRPRGVIVSHENIIANARAVLGEVPIGTSHAETGVTWLPQHHDMGLIGYYLFPVLVGGTTVGMSPFDFLRKPALWLRAISRTRGTYASAPNFGFEYCLRPGRISDEEVREVDLSSLRWLMSAAEPVRPEIRALFAARFAACGLAPETCVAAYGLAENTLAVTHHGRRTLRLDAARLRGGQVHRADAENSDAVLMASCGEPLPGVAVRIVDPHTRQTLGEGMVGEVWIAASASTSVGYWNDPVGTNTTFGQRLADDSRDSEPAAGWLRSGDLGFLDNRELFICGRTKDVIIFRGANYFPQDIEVAAEAVPGVKPGGVAAVSGDDGTLAVLVEQSAGRPFFSPAELARTIQARCHILPRTIAVFPPGTLIRTTSGKLARGPTRERFAAGTIVPFLLWHPETTPDGDDSAAGLRARFGKLLAKGEALPETATLADAGFDSLMLTDLLLALEAVLKSLGGTSVIETLDLSLFQRLTIGRFRRLLDELEEQPPDTINALGAELENMRDEAASATALRMRDDARLEPVFAATGADRPPERQPTPVTDVLMTGVTGFFGPFLLESLLRQTNWRYRVLVRASDPVHAIQRVRAALGGYGLLASAITHGFESRVAAVCGDIAASDWGLSGTAWHREAGAVQAILHNAAQVNWVADYEALRPVNVEGTRTMLRFARTGRPKRVHHISTTFIFGWTRGVTLLESDSNDGMENLDFGYAQSKWVAERLVLAAQRDGLDARIYRPAIVSASISGVGHPADAAVRVLAFMINHGIAVRTANQLSILPADIAADNIAAIITQDDPPGRTFHVTLDGYCNIVDLTRVLTVEHGYDFEYYEIPEFISEMNRRCTRSDPLYPLLDFFNGSATRIAAMQLKRYSNNAYRAACAQSLSARADPALSRTVAAIVAYLRSQGMVGEPSNRR
jgi:thioester reductase-like protein